eukprot:TRINITY_DN2044_c0_g1_i1.p1 TRINITY_DN2044_c0_g1~~TRINITY_DN2044_c0_g1_i1.p1  ORF type:complete len:135 (-),score=32.21 TRINITY_DN2044_c0_g1_i1:60-464(-)
MELLKDFFYRTQRRLKVAWTRTDKRALKVEAVRWTIYLGLPILVYHYATPETIFWLKEHSYFGGAQLRNLVTDPEERSQKTIQLRELRAQERDQRILLNKLNQQNQVVVRLPDTSQQTSPQEILGETPKHTPSV